MATQSTRNGMTAKNGPNGKNEYEYMYASARVRVLENHLIGRERLEHLVGCQNSAQVISTLAEYGVKPLPGGADPVGDQSAREELLLGILRRAITDMAETEAEPALIDILRYPYDYNNIKAVLKCHARGVDPAPMLFDFGTAPIEQVLRIPEIASGNASSGKAGNVFPINGRAGEDPLPRGLEFLPPHMSRASVEAFERFTQTGNPQLVDLLLDRACFADMSDAANASGSALAVKAVSMRADLTNLMIAIRLLRMGNGTAGGRAFYEETILPGGTLDTAFLLNAFDAGEKKLLETLAHTSYASFAKDALATDGSLSAIERVADDAWMTLIRSARYVSFGADVLFAYLAANEYVVKNLRIILAGKDTGLAPEVIRERLRLSYV